MVVALTLLICVCLVPLSVCVLIERHFIFFYFAYLFNRLLLLVVVVVDFNDRSFDINPEKRASAEQLLMHPFIRSACSKEDFGRFCQKQLKRR